MLIEISKEISTMLIISLPSLPPTFVHAYRAALHPAIRTTLSPAASPSSPAEKASFSGQLWGVASFLAPQSSDSQISESVDRSESSDQDESNSAGIDGIRSDLSEIGGRFRTGISNLSNNKAVFEFSKLASDFLQFVSEEGETVEDYAHGGVIGVTEEVLAFAREVALHPEIWLDFPLPEEGDFLLSS